MSAHATSIRDERLALFLDVDGALLEIAATPDRASPGCSHSGWTGPRVWWWGRVAVAIPFAKAGV